MYTADICMAGHWRRLPGLGFSHCFWVERDGDRGRWLQKGTSRSLLIYLWRDIFEPYMPPWVVREFGGRKPPRHRRNAISPCSEICMPLCFGTVDYTARGGRGFFFFLSVCSSSSFFRLCNNDFFLNFFFLLFFFLQFPFSLFFLFPLVLVLFL